jgi:hypothetical protein
MSAGAQATSATAMNTTAATPLTIAASTFLSALSRCRSSSGIAIPIRASRMIPWAAPKYPP